MKKFFLALNLVFAFSLAAMGHTEMAAYSLLGPGALEFSANLGAAELLKRYFHTEIQQYLFPDNTFLSRAINDDAYVNNNSVELPHSGTIPGATVDRTVLPATIAKRTDTPTQYLLEELTTDPTLLQDSEGLIVAYNKRQSILQQHAETINDRAANRALYKWGAGANAAHILTSTGTTRAASGPSQTGNRKGLAKADLIRVRQMFFKDNVVKGNVDVMGIAVLTPEQYGDLLAITDLTEAAKYGRATFPSGVIDRALGFDIYVRSSVVVVTAADALKAEGAAAAATDQDAALFFHPTMVRRAVGAKKVYVDEDKPEYYGSVFSSMARFGALAARADNKGVVILSEDTI